MKITKTDVRILGDLYKSSDGLTAYIFFQRYKYGPSVVYDSISKLEKKNYLINKSDKFFLTEEGREFVLQNRFHFTNNKFDRIPLAFLVAKLQVNESYIPNYKKISKELLNLGTKDDG